MYKKIFILSIFLTAFSYTFPATMNSRVRQVPKNIQEQVFITPKETLPELVKFLAGSSGDVLSRAKILHDWICDNIAYDCDIFTDKGAGEQGYEAVLKKKKAVCIGYANIFNAMCYYAGIEQQTICGWSKGFMYPGYLREESDHAWNAVKVGNRWQLIDVTWDAGFVDYGKFIKNYSTQWLNLTPAQFIYSHLPEEDKWQLLPEKQIRSKEQFVKEPYLAGVFFEYGLSFGKAAPDYTNYISEASFFDISSSKQNVSIISDIYGEGIANLDQACWFENSGRTKRLIFDVPDKNTYKIRVGAKDGTVKNPHQFSRQKYEQNILPQARNLLNQKKITQNEYNFLEKTYYLIEENQRYYLDEDLFDNARNNAVTKILKLLKENTENYENVLSVEVKASPEYEGFGNNTIRFPQMYLGYAQASNIKLISPLQGTLSIGNEQHFELSTNSYSKLAIVLEGNKFVFFEKNQKTGSFQLDYAIPSGISELGIYASKDGKQYSTLFVYKVE